MKRKGLAVVSAALWSGMALAAFGGPVNYGTAGGVYFQDFNSLSATGTAGTQVPWSDGTTIEGWYASIANPSPSAPPANYRVSDGAAFSGALYSFGTTDDPDRSLGALASNTTGAIRFGLQLVNTTGQTLDTVTITYTGEQWRATDADQHALAFGYALGSSINGPLAAVSELDFSAPLFGASVAADSKVDGNATAYRTTISHTFLIPGGWQPGQILFPVFTEANDPSSDQGLAIDDFSFSATAAPAVPTPAALGGGLLLACLLAWRRSHRPTAD